jgi:hypothetical protein
MEAQNKITVVPAQAGIHAGLDGLTSLWIPACAGTTNLYILRKSQSFLADGNQAEWQEP